jgi:hypothetical protein
LLMDITGKLSVPYYPFNLNVADAIDLQTIKGVDEADAQRIVSWRNAHGYYRSVDELRRIPKLSVAGLLALKNATYDSEYASKYQQERSSFKAMFIALITSYLLRGFGYLALAWLLIFIWFRDLSFRQGIFRSASYIANTIVTFLVYLLGLLIAVAWVDPSWKVVVILGVGVVGVALLVYRKSPEKRRRSLLFNMVMLLMVLYSMI